MREQRIVLEYHAEAAIFRLELVDAPVVDVDAPAGGAEQPRDAVERRGLAAARWAEQCDEFALADHQLDLVQRSEEHTSELQSLMRISYAVFCLKKKKKSTKL